MLQMNRIKNVAVFKRILSKQEKQFNKRLSRRNVVNEGAREKDFKADHERKSSLLYL